MSDVYKINVSILKSCEKDFKAELNNFNNKTYTTFSSSYLKNCSDAYVRRMSNELQTLYDKIKKGYQNIDKWWVDYNENIEGLENYLSDNGSVGAISESSVRNSANQLPNLKKYNIKFSGIIPATIVGASYNTVFANNTVASSIDPFSSLYSDYRVSEVNANKVVNNDNIVNQIDEALSTASESVAGWAKNIGSSIKDFFVSTGAKISSFGETVVSKATEVIEDVDNFFDETKAYIANKAESLWDKTTEWWNDTTQKVDNWFDEVGTNISNGAKSLWADVTDWWSDVEAWWNSEALPWIENAATAIWSVVKSVGATVAVFVQSLVEGILQFGEAIIDFVTLVGTGVASIVTGLIDGGQAIYGAITGNEWSSLTKQMWEGTKGFVSNKYVSGWFDSLYQNTSYGQWLAENAYGFDITRSIGSGIGYIAGIVVLTIATFGAGSVVAAGGSVTAATTATQMAVTATAAGIGRGTQNAWADGADLLEGLAAGTLTGLWEGLQFYIGGRIGATGGWGDKIAFKILGSNSVFSYKLISSLSRIILDGVDGGVEGFVIPLITSIYKDGYYDENGNYIDFSDDENIFERYSEVFDDNGGWTEVWTQAAIGSGTSLLGELLDLRKYFKEDNKIQVDDADITATLELNPIDDANITATLELNPIDDANITATLELKTTIDFQEKIDALSAFQDEMLKDQISDQEVLDLMYKTFNNAIDDGNLEALNVLKTFTELKKNNPDLKVVLSSDRSSCYWSSSKTTIVIGTAHVAMGDSGTLCHELGHCLYDSVLGGELPDNWNVISEKARVISSYGNVMTYFGDTLEAINFDTYNAAKQEFEQQLMGDFGITLNEYEKALVNQYTDYLRNVSEEDLKKFLKDMGCNDKEITIFLSTKYDAKDLANIDIYQDIRGIQDQINRTQYSDYCAISDIIDAVYEGTRQDLKGNKLKITYQHGSEYYSIRSSNAPFHEIIANFTQLKITGNEYSLNIVKDIFGKEFYDLLEAVFSKFCYNK